MSHHWSFRPLRPDDLDELLPLQEAGAVVGLAAVFPQDQYPFPVAAVRARWERELADDDVAAYVATDGDRLVGFAARREDELLHFGTALDTWGSGLAAWLHDRLLRTWPDDVRTVRAWVFAGNARGRAFYERLGWTRTGAETRSTFPPYAVLLEHAVDRPVGPGAG